MNGQLIVTEIFKRGITAGCPGDRRGVDPSAGLGKMRLGGRRRHQGWRRGAPEVVCGIIQEASRHSSLVIQTCQLRSWASWCACKCVMRAFNRADGVLQLDIWGTALTADVFSRGTGRHWPMRARSKSPSSRTRRMTIYARQRQPLRRPGP